MGLGGGKPGALILVSVPTIQPVVAIPLPILLLFQTLFHRKQLQEHFEARFKAVFETPPCLFVLNRQRLRPTLLPLPRVAPQKIEVTPDNSRLFLLSLSLPPPSHKACESLEPSCSTATVTPASSLERSPLEWAVGVPASRPTGLPSNGERYLERRR